MIRVGLTPLLDRFEQKLSLLRNQFLNDEVQPQAAGAQDENKTDRE
jgi:hypothetical protein